MSSDVVVVCQENDETFKIDEAFMGRPFSEFGQWFSSRFSGAPTVVEQMAGVTEHFYTLIVEADLIAVSYALATMALLDELDRDEFLSYFHSLIGHHISVENR